MAGHPPSSTNPYIPPIAPPNKPSFMEDAMASLRFDTALDRLTPYNPATQVDSIRSTPPPRMQSITRHHHHSHPSNTAVNLDPVPGDPDTVFIRAPFVVFPGSSERKTSLCYNDMAANPNWFLDITDFIGPNAVGYPPQLEPPRGWCPTKKKDGKDGWKEGEEPRLRCTLCRRQYAGVNAKSMWRRHVYEKHKIAMANRRDNNDRPGGRGGRSSNKENKAAPSSTVMDKESNAWPAPKALRRVVSLEVQASGPSSSTCQAEPLTTAAAHDNIADDTHHVHSSGEEEHSFVEGPSYSSTPPQTPGLSDPLAPPFDIVVPPESPYNPLMTPAFRHSPARLPSKQIWRFTPKVGHKVRDYTLAMLARGEASPNVRGLDVSPIVLVPASERQKRSIFSPPRKSALAVSPRRLFSETVEGDSIQSRLDQPGWDASSTPGNALLSNLLVSPGQGLPPSDFEECIRDWIEANPDSLELPVAPVSSSTPCRTAGVTEGAKSDYFMWAGGQNVPPSPLPLAQYTPRTKMFINGIVSPPKGPDSSPIPSLSAGPSTGSRGRGGSLSPSPRMTSIPFTPLLPPFSVGGLSPPISSGNSFPLDTPDIGMEIDEASTGFAEIESPAKASSLPLWHDLFHPVAGSSTSGDGAANVVASISLSGSFASVNSFSVSGGLHNRKAASPCRSSDRGRSRSASNASASLNASTSTASSSQKSSIGLMDAVLDKKSRRRKHSHSEYRGDGEVGVTAMGSPFKMGRKTSRSEFLYSLDGDCEMQDAQTKKRRKTISGRD